RLVGEMEAVRHTADCPVFRRRALAARDSQPRHGSESGLLYSAARSRDRRRCWITSSRLWGRAATDKIALAVHRPAGLDRDKAFVLRREPAIGRFLPERCNAPVVFLLDRRLGVGGIQLPISLAELVAGQRRKLDA